MKKLLASLLAISIAITGSNMTTYAKNVEPRNGLCEQEDNPHMIAVEGGLWEILAELKEKKSFHEKELYLNKAIEEANKELDAQLKELAASTDNNNRKNVKARVAATRMKLSVLTKRKEAASKKFGDQMVVAGMCFGVVIGFLFTHFFTLLALAIR